MATVSSTATAFAASPNVTNASFTSLTIHALSSTGALTITTSNATSSSYFTTVSDGGGNASECAQGLIWVYQHLGQCYETPTQVVAFSMAVVAIALWFVAHAILFKSQRDEPDCNCSRLCLLIVAGLGSVSNLVGCTLCDQLGTQVLTACYLVLSDVVFLVQWMHSWNRNRKLNVQGLSFYASSDSWRSPDRTREEQAMNGGHALVLCLCTPCFLTVFYALALPWQHSSDRDAAMPHWSAGGRKLLMVSETSTDNFGYTMGFVALAFHAVYRIPTILNELRHKITFREPLVSHGFIISASICYLISVVAYDTEPSFLLNALPWLLLSLLQVGLSIILILVVRRNRAVGPTSHASGRRKADGSFLLARSEESLNSDLERNATLSFTDDVSANAASKLPSIQEEPQLETCETGENEIIPGGFVDITKELDVETASIHSRASDFILDDDEDVYVRGDDDDEDVDMRAVRGRMKNYDDDGLEWDFEDIRPKYNGNDSEPQDGSPIHHHSFGIPGVDEIDDDWDEERVLNEIERELQMADEKGVDADTASMDYDTADDEEQFYQKGSYAYMPASL